MRPQYYVQSGLVKEQSKCTDDTRRARDPCQAKSRKVEAQTSAFNSPIHSEHVFVSTSIDDEDLKRSARMDRLRGTIPENSISTFLNARR